MRRKLWPILFIPWSPFLFSYFFAFKFRKAKSYKKSTYIQFITFLIMILLHFPFAFIPSLYPQWLYSAFMLIKVFSFITIGQIFIYLFSICLSLYLIDYYEKNINKNDQK